MRPPGLAALYAESAIRSSDEGAKAPEFAAKKLELATGDELYYVGASLFPGQRFGLTRLSRTALGGAKLDRDRQVIVSFTPPGESRRLIAAAQPVQLVRGTEPFGWLIVAKPETELREQWLTLLGRLALALAVGIVLAGGLFWWLSRRITEPVRALTRATEDVAAGRYDVEIPEASGADEIALLSQRFRAMVAQLAEAEQLKRSFLMSVSHELRTPLTAIRGHVEAIREGIVADPEQVRDVARHRRCRDRPARAARRRRAGSREAPGPPRSRCGTRRSTSSGSSIRRTALSPRRRGGGRSTTASRAARGRP